LIKPDRLRSAKGKKNTIMEMARIYKYKFVYGRAPFADGVVLIPFISGQWYASGSNFSIDNLEIEYSY
jgi:hypothetical protein